MNVTQNKNALTVKDMDIFQQNTRRQIITNLFILKRIEVKYKKKEMHKDVEEMKQR